MEIITFSELCNIFNKHNEDNNITQQFSDKNPLIGGICFHKNSFNGDFTEKERTYTFRSDNKYFISGLNGKSIFANCEDGTDQGIRLDYYLNHWTVDYCFIK